MSASIYGVLKWCTLPNEEINRIVEEISGAFTYKGEDFYNEVERRGGWADPTEDNDSVCIWSGDDYGPIIVNGKEIGLLVHYDLFTGEKDGACLYEMPF